MKDSDNFSLARVVNHTFKNLHYLELANTGGIDRMVEAEKGLVRFSVRLSFLGADWRSCGL